MKKSSTKLKRGEKQSKRVENSHEQTNSLPRSLHFFLLGYLLERLYPW